MSKEIKNKNYKDSKFEEMKEKEILNLDIEELDDKEMEETSGGVTKDVYRTKYSSKNSTKFSFTCSNSTISSYSCRSQGFKIKLNGKTNSNIQIIRQKGKTGTMYLRITCRNVKRVNGRNKFYYTNYNYTIYYT